MGGLLSVIRQADTQEVLTKTRLIHYNGGMMKTIWCSCGKRNGWMWGRWGFMCCDHCRKPSMGVWKSYVSGNREW